MAARKRTAPAPGARDRPSSAPSWPGSSFGAPERGEGAVAGTGQRVLAFAIDATAAALIAWAVTAPEPPRNWSLLVWAAVTVLGVGLLGSTPGHLIAGTRVATLRGAGGGSLVGLWSVPRTLLVALMIPPLLQDSDGRGLHDRICHTVVVRTR